MIKRPTGSDPSQWKIEPSRLLEDFKGWGEWEEHSEGFNTIERYTPIKKDGKWTITTGVAGLGNVRAYMLADSPLSVLIDKNKEISIPFDCTNISH
jgi:hypothetical protein